MENTKDLQNLREMAGRPLATLATTIKQDLAGKDVAMENTKDLQNLREVAGDKRAWSQLGK